MYHSLVIHSPMEGHPGCYCLFTFIKDQLTVFMGVYFWSLCSVSLSIILPVPHYLNHYSFILSLQVR